jgi:hypothetical protein
MREHPLSATPAKFVSQVRIPLQTQYCLAQRGYIPLGNDNAGVANNVRDLA